MYQFGLNDFVSTLFDDDINKIGRFSPGLGLPVLGINELSAENFETVVILAWQHSEVLSKRLLDIEYDGVTFCIMPSIKRIVPTNLAK